jgi:hypothetical protein
MSMRAVNFTSDALDDNGFVTPQLATSTPGR